MHPTSFRRHSQQPLMHHRKLNSLKNLVPFSSMSPISNRHLFYSSLPLPPQNSATPNSTLPDLTTPLALPPRQPLFNIHPMLLHLQMHLEPLLRPLPLRRIQLARAIIAPDARQVRKSCFLSKYLAFRVFDSARRRGAPRGQRRDVVADGVEGGGVEGGEAHEGREGGGGVAGLEVGEGGEEPGGWRWLGTHVSIQSLTGL